MYRADFWTLAVAHSLWVLLLANSKRSSSKFDPPSTSINYISIALWCAVSTMTKGKDWISDMYVSMDMRSQWSSSVLVLYLIYKKNNEIDLYKFLNYIQCIYVCYYRQNRVRLHAN